MPAIKGVGRVHRPEQAKEGPEAQGQLADIFPLQAAAQKPVLVLEEEHH